jgi:peptide/nickel transport system permease protein
MSADESVGTTRQLAEERNNLANAVRRFADNRMAIVGFVIIVVFALVAIFAPQIAPYEPEAQTISDRLQPPGAQYLMGTDKLGRDVLSRSIHAARVSLPIGLLSMAIAMVVGVGVGVLAGYYGGRLDNVLMRITDLFLSFPIFFLLITIAALFGPSIGTIILMLGFTSWASTARILRGQVLSIREMDYVDAARAIGVKDRRIIVRHILVNSLSVITVTATLMVAYAILIEGGLSYLGLGVQPPTPSWGNMMSDGRDVLRVAWWPSLLPGLFLMLVVIAFNLVGDGLRDFFDPTKQIRKKK